ncbi:MAG: hypothetical protein ACK4N1_04905, partial [Pseudorhizobium sp.]
MNHEFPALVVTEKLHPHTAVDAASGMFRSVRQKLVEDERQRHADLVGQLTIVSTHLYAQPV